VSRLEAGGSGPIVLSFLQGPPPHSVPLSATSGDAEAPLVLRYLGGAGDGRRAHHRRLEAESASIVYSAQNFGESVGGGPPGYRYAVGVVSRKRDSVRLYEADGGGAVFGLQADASRGLTLLLGEAGAALARESTELGGMDSRAKRSACSARNNPPPPVDRQVRSVSSAPPRLRL
jgi:hypothetical protein